MGDRILWVQSDRFPIFANRILQIAFRLQRVAKAQVGLKQVGFQPYRFAQFEDCSLHVLLQCKDEAEVAVRFREAWVQAQSGCLLYTSPSPRDS